MHICDNDVMRSFLKCYLSWPEGSQRAARGLNLLLAASHTPKGGRAILAGKERGFQICKTEE